MTQFSANETRQSDNSYIRYTMQQPLLEREHEVELATKWRDEGDDRAMHELVMAYARIVVSAASRYRYYGLSNGDLIQEGNIGLMQAAKRFDPDRGVRFSTYAAWWIRASIQDHILRNWSIVRTGTTAAHKSLFFKLRRLRARIGEADGGPLSHEGRQKIAETIGVTVADVTVMEQRLSGADGSLNAAVSQESESEAQDFLADDRPNPEQVVIELHDGEVLSRWLNDALSELSPRERLIIMKRRLQDDGATLEQLGGVLGVSKERVRQLEHRALKKLKKSLEEQSESPLDLLPQIS
ncbi:MAG: RNA polymerase factor sigma-32 [Alphaproteobacteria bacterium]|jgi:RNA polymerase sigma-32 factor|nr:RNA polymerase factor sigma-32 [Alphaproteobacteria bacterium]MBT5728374.1 RNA polymerase factor sigma-32 [Alphaproteobacteria bacterium]MDA7775894.1 RNA polymerase factor sigma-32 [Alphaproteobacteria bacterium]